MKMFVCLNAAGRAFQDDEGNFEPEMPVADILEDLAAQLRSGTKMVDLHCEKLRAWNGQKVGTVMITGRSVRT